MCVNLSRKQAPRTSNHLTIQPPLSQMSWLLLSIAQYYAAVASRGVLMKAAT
jgi:hypothetical protein